MKKDNSILLRNWLSKTLVNNPDLIIGKNVVEIYSALQDIWLEEVQLAFKSIISEIKLIQQEPKLK